MSCLRCQSNKCTDRLRHTCRMCNGIGIKFGWQGGFQTYVKCDHKKGKGKVT